MTTKKTLVSFLIFFFIQFCFGEGFSDLPNGYARKPSDSKSIQVSVISQKQANDLFKKLKNDKAIPYDFSFDGCYARATAMSIDAEKEGIITARIVAQGQLSFFRKGAIFEKNEWPWHVSIVAQVKSESGRTETMVFDPSMFDQPVTVDSWKKSMLSPTKEFKPKIDAVYFGSRFQYNPRSFPGRSDFEENKTKWDQDVIEGAKETNMAYNCKLDIQLCPGWKDRSENDGEDDNDRFSPSQSSSSGSGAR